LIYNQGVWSSLQSHLNIENFTEIKAWLIVMFCPKLNIARNVSIIISDMLFETQNPIHQSATDITFYCYN